MRVKFKHVFGLSCPSKSVSNTLSNKQFQLVLPWRINRNIGTIDLVASISSNWINRMLESLPPFDLSESFIWSQFLPSLPPQHRRHSQKQVVQHLLVKPGAVFKDVGAASIPHLLSAVLLSQPGQGKNPAAFWLLQQLLLDEIANKILEILQKIKVGHVHTESQDVIVDRKGIYQISFSTH